MTPSDPIYCGHCGGASPRGASECRFCGAALPRARHEPSAEPTASAADAGEDDPWADLEPADTSVPTGGEPHDEPWADPARSPWHDEQPLQAPVGGVPGADEPTRVADAAAGVPPRDEPTLVDTGWVAEGVIEPGPDEPRRGLPGWAWVATVVLLGTLLGVGAYVVVDRADSDGDSDSVRTEQTTTTVTSTSSTTSSTTSTSSTSTTTVPPTTTVVPATPPATAPSTGPPTVPGAVSTPTSPAPPTAPPTTPAPTTAPPTTPAPTTAPPTTPAPTTTGPDDTVPGDLGIPGVPMSQPPCDGGYVTFLASAKDTSGPAMQEALEGFPGSHYLRTDQTCASLDSPAADGSPLYRIFAGPFDEASDACAARSQSPYGAFVKRASSDDPPTHVVECD